MGLYKGLGVIPPETAGRTLTVRGSHASLNEYNVAVALERLGLDFIFQYDILGGRRLRGGAVIDFLVLTIPLPTPVFVNGDYWHRDATQEFYQRALVDQALRGQARPVIVLWGYESDTIEAATSAIRSKVL